MSDNPEKAGLDGRGREKSGRIDHKHPTTKIKHLREHYGAHFANGWDGERTLGELLSETKFESLTQYVKHHAELCCRPAFSLAGVCKGNGRISASPRRCSLPPE